MSNDSNVIPIPDRVVNVLLSKTKTLGRKMILSFLLTCVLLFGIWFLTEFFPKSIRFIMVFVSSGIFLLSFIGYFLERRNILNDLYTGKAYLVSGFRESPSGYISGNILYEKLFDNEIISNNGFVLPCSRYVFKDH